MLAEIKAGKHEDVFDRKSRKNQKEIAEEEEKKEFNIIIEEPVKKVESKKVAAADQKQA